LPKTSDLSVGTSPVIMVKWLANLPWNTFNLKLHKILYIEPYQPVLGTFLTYWRQNQY
jgi:hypothetical protein